MKREGNSEGKIGPVDLRKSFPVQQKEIGSALLPIKDDGHENPIVFLNSSGARYKEHLARVVTVLGPHFVIR